MKSLAVTPEELRDRKALLDNLDAFRKAAGQTNAIAADTFHERAFDVLTSSKMVEALDVTKEPERTRDRYGRGSPRHQGDGAPQWNDQLLMARRLVEAGVRCVSVAYGFWDTHGGNFRHLRGNLPLVKTEAVADLAEWAEYRRALLYGKEGDVIEAFETREIERTTLDQPPAPSSS